MGNTYSANKKCSNFLSSRYLYSEIYLSRGYLAYAHENLLFCVICPRSTIICHYNQPSTHCYALLYSEISLSCYFYAISSSRGHTAHLSYNLPTYASSYLIFPLLSSFCRLLFSFPFIFFFSIYFSFCSSWGPCWCSWWMIFPLVVLPMPFWLALLIPFLILFVFLSSLILSFEFIFFRLCWSFVWFLFRSCRFWWSFIYLIL